MKKKTAVEVQQDLENAVIGLVKDRQKDTGEGFNQAMEELRGNSLFDTTLASLDRAKAKIARGIR